MRIGRKHLLYGVIAAPFAALFGAWVGIFNVAASTGHWEITDWFLHFAMRSSVRTYALAAPPPPVLSRSAATVP